MRNAVHYKPKHSHPKTHTRTRPETETLRRSQALLDGWEDKLTEVRSFLEDLESPSEAAQGLTLQSLNDRFEHAENAVLRLRQLEDGWRRARARVERSLADLDAEWRAVNLSRAVSPELVGSSN